MTFFPTHYLLSKPKITALIPGASPSAAVTEGVLCLVIQVKILSICTKVCLKVNHSFCLYLYSE